jgi:hypothetical protein
LYLLGGRKDTQWLFALYVLLTDDVLKGAEERLRTTKTFDLLSFSCSHLNVLKCPPNGTEVNQPCN